MSATASTIAKTCPAERQFMRSSPEFLFPFSGRSLRRRKISNRSQKSRGDPRLSELRRTLLFDIGLEPVSARSQTCQVLPRGCSRPALLKSNDDGLLRRSNRKRGGADEFHAEPYTIRVFRRPMGRRAIARCRPAPARLEKRPVSEQAAVARQARLAPAPPLPV